MESGSHSVNHCSLFLLACLHRSHLPGWLRVCACDARVSLEIRGMKYALNCVGALFASFSSLQLNSPSIRIIRESNTNPIEHNGQTSARGNLRGDHVSVHEPTQRNCPTCTHMPQKPPRRTEKQRTRAKLTMPKTQPIEGNATIIRNPVDVSHSSSLVCYASVCVCVR